MSFKCGKCANPQANGVKPVVVVLQTRAISYPVRYRNGVVIDRGGNGTAIVREEKLCKSCAAQHSVQTDADWYCKKCGFENHGSWSECGECQTPRS